MLAVLVLTSGSCLLAGAVWARWAVLNNEVAEVGERHLVIARTLSGTLAHYHSDVTTALASAAPLLGSEAGPDGLLPVLRSFGFRTLCRHDRDGHALVAQAIGDCPARPGPEIEALAATLSPDARVAIAPAQPAAPGGEPLLPLLVADGTGYVVGYLGTRFFRALAREVSFGRNGHAAIVDGQGRVLAHPLSAWSDSARDVSALLPVRMMLAGETGVTRFHSPALDAEMIVGVAAVPGPGWGVMVPQPLSDLEAVAREIATSGWKVLVLGSGLVLIVGVAFAAIVGAPVARVARAARRMSDGEEAGSIARTAGNSPVQELADLCQAFDRMAEQVSAAQAREHALRLGAEAEAQSKGRFLARMSHEIRTPLNGVLGLMAVVERTALDERQTMLLRKMRESGTALMRVLDDILDMSRLEAGAMPIVASPFDLRAALEAAAALMGPEIEGRGLTLSVSLEPEVPELVTGDRDRLKQVLINLLSNAAKFTDAGHVRITAAPVPGDPRDIEIAVTDTGIGIRSERQEAIFEEFVQAEPGTMERFGGSGLGLAIARMLVTAMGGVIGVESAPGQGSRFWVRLPLVAQVGAPDGPGA